MRRRLRDVSPGLYQVAITANTDNPTEFTRSQAAVDILPMVARQVERGDEKVEHETYTLTFTQQRVPLHVHRMRCLVGVWSQCHGRMERYSLARPQ